MQKSFKLKSRSIYLKPTRSSFYTYRRIHYSCRHLIFLRNLSVFWKKICCEQFKKVFIFQFCLVTLLTNSSPGITLNDCQKFGVAAKIYRQRALKFLIWVFFRSSVILGSKLHMVGVYAILQYTAIFFANTISFIGYSCNQRSNIVNTTRSNGSVRVLQGRPSKSMGNGKI